MGVVCREGSFVGRASTHSTGATKGLDLFFYHIMARENLENLIMIFWEAEDDALMEEFTIIESLMITRFGLFSDDRGMKVDFCTMKTYGIFAVNHATNSSLVTTKLLSTMSRGLWSVSMSFKPEHASTTTSGTPESQDQKNWRPGD
jgi:hypothetical protein